MADVSVRVRLGTAVLLVLLSLAVTGCGDGGDGFRLVFYSDRDGDDDIYVMETAGGIRQLADGPGRDYEASGSPDGSTIVFASERGGGDDTQLYLVNVDGSGLRRLTFSASDDAVVVDDYPHWAPDGRRIVFQRTTILEESPDADIWLIDVESGEETQLTATPDAWDSTPSFSSDGNAVLFESNRDGDFDLYRLDLETLQVGQINNEAGRDSGAKESPDRRQLAFTSDRDGDPEIYLMDSDGENVQRLTDNDVEDRYPHWSPDGELILFDSQRDGDREICVMNADGSGQRRLTTSSGNDADPHWLVGR